MSMPKQFKCADRDDVGLPRSDQSSVPADDGAVVHRAAQPELRVVDPPVRFPA